MIDQLPQLTFLAQGEEGPGRSYWFIALLIIFAIQHLAEKFKQKREAQDEVELQRRREEIDEELIDEEIGGYEDPNPSGETLADFFRGLTQPAQQAPPPPVPAQIPPPRQRASAAPPKPAARKPSPTLSAEEQRALAALKKRGSHDNLIHGRTRRQRMHSSSSHTALGSMLGSPENLRNAFILKEILDPPVASREDSEPHSF